MIGAAQVPHRLPVEDGGLAVHEGQRVHAAVVVHLLEPEGRQAPGFADRRLPVDHHMAALVSRMCLMISARASAPARLQSVNIRVMRPDSSISTVRPSHRS